MKILLTFLFLIVSVPAFAWQNITQDDPYQYSFASGTAVKTVKTGGGILHSITIGGGTASAFDIYDGPILTSALIYSFTSTNTLGTILLDVGFSSGCTVVTNGAIKYTVAYK